MSDDRAAKIAEIERLRKIEEINQLRAAEADRPRPKTSIGESAVRGAGQGITAGFSDEMMGGMDWLLANLTPEGREMLRVNKELKEQGFGDQGPTTAGEMYEQGRDEERVKNKQASEDNPWTYGGSQVGGAILTAFAPGLGAVNSAKAANATGGAAARLAPSLTAGAVRTIGKEGLGRIGIAAAQGGLTGAGMSEANPLESPDKALDFLGDVGTGAAISGAAQGVVTGGAPLVKDGMKMLPSALKGKAERLAFKAAVGNQGKAWDDAVANGRVNSTGRDLLDDGMVAFGDNARSIASKAKDVRSAVGMEMDDLFSKVDEAVPDGVFDGAAAGAKLREYADEIGGSGNKQLVSRLHEAANDLETGGRMTLAKAQVEKNSWKYSPGDALSVPKEVANKVKSLIGTEMEEAVERYGTSASLGAEGQRAAVAGAIDPIQPFGEMLQTGSGRTFTAPRSPLNAVVGEAESAGRLDPDKTRQLYEGLKKKYGSAASTVQNATKLANRQDKNRALSLTDYITGAAGATSGGPLAGIASAVGNKVLRERGNASVAVGLDKVGDLLARVPEKFGKFAAPLKAAADRGGNALAVTHFLLMQSEPEYRSSLLDEDE